MSSIFEKRTNLKPYEYPELLEFKDAIRHAYWVHTEFNYTSDVQDFKVNCSEVEQDVMKKTMLAIAQIEVTVKTFWADLYKKLPKPEVGAVGMTFADSEVRHMDAYSHLLEIMGLNEEFENIENIPAIQDRINYLESSLKMMRTGRDPQTVMSILLFSIFVEHVSLFSQFLIMSAFDKHEKKFKGIANAVEATSKEEQIHGLFGIKLIEIIKKERPEWFGDQFDQLVVKNCMKAFNAEMKILDWIFEKGELDFISRHEINEFIKDKFNRSLKHVDIDPVFKTDEGVLSKTKWFYDDILMTKDNDFFSKRGTTYNKKTKSVTKKDLF